MATAERHDTEILTADERQRIRAEEIERYRARVEAEQAYGPKKTSLHKLREFFNSGLGIWTLSTLVLGFGTYQYRLMEERSARRTEADRLEIELRHRLALFHKIVAGLDKEVHDTQDAGNDPWGLKFASRLRSSYRYIQTPESAFFSNFARDNVQALFTALQDKLRGVDDKKSRVIDDCLARLKVVHQRCEEDYHNVPRPDNEKAHADYYQQVQWMIGEVLDCLRSNPLQSWSALESSAAKGP
jgi:hypothetical protein